MTINLPEELNRFIRAEVQNGHFASEEDAVAEGVRLLLRQVSEQKSRLIAEGPYICTSAPDPVLGAMCDAAGEIDDIVAEAMQHREQQPWRLPSP